MVMGQPDAGIVRALDAIEFDAGSVLTVGTFDGVHRGHQAIIRYLIGRAEARQGRSVVVTFDPHPREVVHGELVPLLTTLQERAALFADLGVDRMVVIPFTEAFSALSPEEFVRDVLAKRIGMQEIVIGYDHAFGKGRRGGKHLLEEIGGEIGFAVDPIPAQVIEEHVVSSTEIRQSLREKGDVQHAEKLLGRPYSLEGTVIRGDGRGHKIGFPTANLEISHPRKLIPREGVYAVRVETEGASALQPGMMNIGRRPTFSGTSLRLEVHLFDTHPDLYNQRLRVEFAEWLRAERKFESVSALVEQLSEDRRRCRHALVELF